NSQSNLDVADGNLEAFGWNENELSVARWVFDRTQMAGAGSDTLSGARGLYVPMKGIRSTVGVLGIRPDDPKTMLDPERLQLFETFASEIGGALESTRMSEEIGRNEIQMELQAIRNPQFDTRLRVGDFLAKERVVVFSAESSREKIMKE